MKPNSVLFRICVVVELVCAFSGCSRGGHEPHTKREALGPSSRDTPDSRPTASGVLLEGTVIQKPWTKTYESWNAGGSEYYVLDVGDSPVEHRTAQEGVILRPSDEVPFDVLGTYQGRCVRVRGEYVQAQPYTPLDSGEQYPVDPQTGRPESRGAGFRVHQIEILRSDR